MIVHHRSSNRTRCEEAHGTEISVSKLSTQKYRNVLSLMNLIYFDILNVFAARGTSGFPAKPRLGPRTQSQGLDMMPLANQQVTGQTEAFRVETIHEGGSAVRNAIFYR